MSSIVGARERMIGLLDRFRDTLQNLGVVWVFLIPYQERLSSK